MKIYNIKYIIFGFRTVIDEHGMRNMVRIHRERAHTLVVESCLQIKQVMNIPTRWVRNNACKATAHERTYMLGMKY